MDRIQKFKELVAPVGLEIWTEQLEEMGFFAAPASTRFHGAYEGGLFDHSYAVTKALLELTEKLGLEWQLPSSPYVIGLLHDLCKCDAYIKTESGYIYNKHQKLQGHGDKSVVLAKTLRVLTDEEELSIRWHMGAFDEKENWRRYTEAIERFPNVLYVHTADMIASQIHKI